jgi:hypothetical protein
MKNLGNWQNVYSLHITIGLSRNLYFCFKMWWNCESIYGTINILSIHNLLDWCKSVDDCAGCWRFNWKTVTEFFQLRICVASYNIDWLRTWSKTFWLNTVFFCIDFEIQILISDNRIVSTFDSSDVSCGKPSFCIVATSGFNIINSNLDFIRRSPNKRAAQF